MESLHARVRTSGNALSVRCRPSPHLRVLRLCSCLQAQSVTLSLPPHTLALLYEATLDGVCTQPLSRYVHACQILCLRGCKCAMRAPQKVKEKCDTNTANVSDVRKKARTARAKECPGRRWGSAQSAGARAAPPPRARAAPACAAAAGRSPGTGCAGPPPPGHVAACENMLRVTHGNTSTGAFMNKWGSKWHDAWQNEGMGAKKGQARQGHRGHTTRCPAEQAVCYGSKSQARGGKNDA